MSETQQILRGGRLLDAAGHSAEPADIVIRGDSIVEIGTPGCAAPDGATVVDARDRLLMPGLDARTAAQRTPADRRRLHRRRQVSRRQAVGLRDGPPRLHRLHRHVRGVPAAVARRAGSGRTGLYRCRYACRHHSDDGDAQFLERHPRPVRRTARSAAARRREAQPRHRRSGGGNLPRCAAALAA